jgi:hypothetical protein
MGMSGGVEESIEGQTIRALARVFPTWAKDPGCRAMTEGTARPRATRRGILMVAGCQDEGRGRRNNRTWQIYVAHLTGPDKREADHVVHSFSAQGRGRMWKPAIIPWRSSTWPLSSSQRCASFLFCSRFPNLSCHLSLPRSSLQIEIVLPSSTHSSHPLAFFGEAPDNSPSSALPPPPDMTSLPITTPPTSMRYSRTPQVLTRRPARSSASRT